MRIPGSPIGDGRHRDLGTLADIVAGAIVGDHGTANVGVTTRHQIVIRFRDGSRQVFNEEKPRTWRVGDRIQVIAGATGANG
jgi:outer membrane lipoprotein SlyB